ncbi:MAG: hypothetical protein ABI255_06280 [Microbacteriaceae bacterium]
MTVTRRSLLQMGVAGPLWLLAGCTPSNAEQAPTQAPRTPTPLPTVAGSAPRQAKPSFGPNGTHYPAEIPWIGETALTEIEVDCTWKKISDAINSLTASQVAAGAVIRVRPGVLIGAGAGSRVTPVLSGSGNAAWERAVVICPRDGYGSVRVLQQGFRIDQCNRLAFFGFQGGDVEFYATNCTFVTVGWSQWSALNFTQSGSHLELYEVILGFRRAPDDTFAVRPTDTNEMTELSRYGCAFGPSVKPAGSASHCDTTQLERTGTGSFGPYTSTDCLDFGSSNSVVLIHDSVSMAQFNHCLILGESLPWQIYPLQSGDYQGNPNAFAGGGHDIRLTDSVVCGPIGRLGFTHVHDTRINYQPVDQQLPSVAGSWTVDPTISSWTGADIEKVVGGEVTPTAMASHWTW